jgi:cyclic pyranopterin phosphate synthase
VSGLSHIDASGEARMVDVGGKPEAERTAVAEGRVRCSAEALRLAVDAGGRKGDVLGAERIAGVLAAKRTAELIPLCHPLALTWVGVDLVADNALPGLRIRAEARCVGRTGVEMEALTAVAVAALTVVDMIKSADRWCAVEGVGLVHKEGGRSGSVDRPADRAL